MLFCPENLGLQVFRVFHCPEAKHTEAWKTNAAEKNGKSKQRLKKKQKDIDKRCPEN